MTKRANEATLSGRPSDPRLAEAQRLHHEERRLQAQARETDRQRSDAWKEAQELQVTKATQEATVQALAESVDRTRSELFQARDKLAQVEREASSLEVKDPARAADLRESATRLRSSIRDLEQVAGQNEARVTAAWDDIKATETQLTARSADVTRLTTQTEQLRTQAEERENAAEALERQRAAEPMRADVPEADLLPDDARKLHEALLNGHKVGVGSDGRIHVSAERSAPMNQEAADYLESKLPELRHRMGEGWSFSIDTNGNITGNGPHRATYFAQPDGQISEQTLGEVRARLKSGQDVSVGPDGTVVTSEPGDPVTQAQAQKNLAAFNKEVSSGSLTGSLAEGKSYDLNPDGSGGYSEPAPLTTSSTAGPTSVSAAPDAGDDFVGDEGFTDAETGTIADAVPEHDPQSTTFTSSEDQSPDDTAHVAQDVEPTMMATDSDAFAEGTDAFDTDSQVALSSEPEQEDTSGTPDDDGMLV